MAAKITDREQLEVKVRATIEWNFGQIADAIDAFLQPCRRHSEPACIACFKSIVRKYGNEAIRVIEGHLQHHNISRNHRADTLNLERIAQRAREGK